MPTQAKFKVGDRVKTIRQVVEYAPGHEFTVEAVGYTGFPVDEHYYENDDILAYEDALHPVWPASSALASWEPIEYRSQPDAGGDCDFIRWDGYHGGWEVIGHDGYFPTPEAAAEWVAKENENG